MDEKLKEVGLIGKYILTKTNGKPINPKAKYFVMRYDNLGDDPIHLQACRDAIKVYCDKIKDHLPLLAQDLITDVNSETK